MLIRTLAAFAGITAANAGLLVYEPFDYAVVNVPGINLISHFT